MSYSLQWKGKELIVPRIMVFWLCPTVSSQLPNTRLLSPLSSQWWASPFSSPTPCQYVLIGWVFATQSRSSHQTLKHNKVPSNKEISVTRRFSKFAFLHLNISVWFVFLLCSTRTHHHCADISNFVTSRMLSVSPSWLQLTFELCFLESLQFEMKTAVSSAYFLTSQGFVGPHFLFRLKIPFLYLNLIP